MSITNQDTLLRLQLARVPKPKKEQKPIAKQSEKKKQQVKEEKQSGESEALQTWFNERRIEMTGRCALCGGKTEKHNDATFKRSIHHLLDKRETMFPSVALHPDNWLEVCHFGNSCHENIHNKTITWELLIDSAEWKFILDKLKKVYPFIAYPERKNIPDVLLKELERI